MRKHSGIFHATLHNVSVGDNCCIENIKNYIANYDIAEDCFVEYEEVYAGSYYGTLKSEV